MNPARGLLLLRKESKLALLGICVRERLLEVVQVLAVGVLVPVGAQGGVGRGPSPLDSDLRPRSYLPGTTGDPGRLQRRLDEPRAPHRRPGARFAICACQGNTLVFTRDVEFNSPSAASATVLARTDNGRNSWRLKGTSVTYAAWQENLPANQPASGRTEV